MYIKVSAYSFQLEMTASLVEMAWNLKKSERKNQQYQHLQHISMFM